jgi:hypothetical protein
MANSKVVGSAVDIADIEKQERKLRPLAPKKKKSALVRLAKMQRKKRPSTEQIAQFKKLGGSGTAAGSKYQSDIMSR